MEHLDFEEKMLLDKIDPVNAVYAVVETLRRINNNLIEHGERVAYIADKICVAGGFGFDKKILHLLCVFHDIGAYKTEEINEMLKFETDYTKVYEHSIYGYLFLKYMTPLKEYAEAILYHHFDWEKLSELDASYKEYAALINLADRIDIGINNAKDTEELLKLLASNKNIFKADYYNAALDCILHKELLCQLADKSYLGENMKLSTSFIHSSQDAFAFLKMIIYTIDFESDHTVTHTINTVAISVNIADHFNLSNQEIEHIYLGAMLHDIGKVAIPHVILESTGRLTPKEMKIMRTHVEETGVLIKDLIPEDIYRIAVRHHEKLNGKGYPDGLSAAELSFSERIIAVADILSALSSTRSYKEAYPKEKTMAIIAEMMGTELDSKICQYVLDDYDFIMKATENSRNHIIAQYLKIKQEYDKILKRFKKMK